MSNRPTISVLIPTYNRASFLPATLGSVFAQTVPIGQVVLVDDGSTDDTAQVVDSFLLQHPEWKDRFHYLSQPNQGKSVALNRALELAQGDWIAYNDSDDEWRPDKLEWQFRALAAMPDCGACVTETSRMELDEALRVHPDWFVTVQSGLGRLSDPGRSLVEGWPGTYMQSLLVQREAVVRCGPFDPDLRIEQDVDFLFRLGLVTNICYVALPLVELNRDPCRAVGLMTSFPHRSLPRVKARNVRLHKWLTHVADVRPSLGPLIAERLASDRSELANCYMLEGDVKSSRSILWQALRESFEPRFLIKWVMAWMAPTLLRAVAKRRAHHRQAQPSPGIS
jgi:glycosyltransferase involved in cell wall biosynthesis